MLPSHSSSPCAYTHLGDAIDLELRLVHDYYRVHSSYAVCFVHVVAGGREESDAVGILRVEGLALPQHHKA